jgi:hypothetical protein
LHGQGVFDVFGQSLGKHVTGIAPREIFLSGYLSP